MDELFNAISNNNIDSLKLLLEDDQVDLTKANNNVIYVLQVTQYKITINKKLIYYLLNHINLTFTKRLYG